MLISPLHLIRSETDQKVEAEPGSNLRGCSQRVSVRMHDEVASLPSKVGLPLGSRDGRASPLRAKSVLLAMSIGQHTSKSVRGGAITGVRQAIMQGKRNVHHTDEVPRRPSSHQWVTPSYKSKTKGTDHASEAGMASPQPCPKGCQQHQSRVTLKRGQEFIERLNHSVFAGLSWRMGPVSNATKATKWPEGTSSFQTAASAKKQTPLPRLISRMVHHS
jgi:hypothetical protein